MIDNLIQTMSERLDAQIPALTTIDQYWNGTQPAAYLSPEAREALGERLRVLSVNYPRLAVSALAERLSVAGFRTSGPDTEPDSELWRIWRANGMEVASSQAHVDALAYGRSYVIVWANDRGPLITVESPKNVTVQRDPATGEVVAAFKRWAADGYGAGALYGPDEIVLVRNRVAAGDGAALPSTGWQVVEKIPNPFGVVPVVPLVNSGRLHEYDGASEMTPVTALSDALAKILTDSLVTSEYYARPRRWATGLEIVEDADGKPVKPFSAALDDVWQSEHPESKFGQFPAADLGSYGDMVATITQQIGAMSGLPPHFLGLHGDQPASADAIRSAEAQLVARAQAKQLMFGHGWAQVAKLAIAARDGSDVHRLDVQTVWSSAETRTPAQAADAAAKLAGIGVPLSVVLADQLGYSPAQIERVREARRAEALDGLATTLPDLLAVTNG